MSEDNRSGNARLADGMRVNAAVTLNLGQLIDIVGGLDLQTAADFVMAVDENIADAGWTRDVIHRLSASLDGELEKGESSATVVGFLDWLIVMDELEGLEQRRTVTLTGIIERAREARARLVGGAS